MSFAHSDAGIEIGYLHLHGTPLAATQAELTDLQRAFLVRALPEVQRRMHGHGASQGTTGSVKSTADTLQQKIEERRKAQRGERI